MAGFFGLFNYEKEGPGISKNAPKKKMFVVFFETYFRNFWKFILINVVHNLITIPLVTNGIATVGITNVTRNIARDKHSFGLSDYFETIKKNWKQGLIAGIINLVIYLVLGFDLYYFSKLNNQVAQSVGCGFVLASAILFTFMNYFIWTLIITFDFSLKTIYKNSFKFAILNFKKNFVCLLSLALAYAVYIAAVFLFYNYFYAALTIVLLIYFLTFPAFKFLLVQYCVFPSIRKYIIDPYYKEHPDEDLEKRRALGIETDTAEYSDEVSPEEIETVKEKIQDEDDDSVIFRD